MNRASTCAALASAVLLSLGGVATAQTATPPGAPGGPPHASVVPGQVVQQGVVLPPGSAVPPGMVQTGTVMVQPQPQGNTRVGRLNCEVAGSVSFVFGSTRDLTCEFRPVNAPAERYVGEIRRFGIDVGVTGRGTMLWDVVNTGTDIRPGSLEGTYAGASSNVSAGVGLGSAALIGGSGDQVALQPLAIESSTGVNVAAGISELRLRPAG